MKPLPRLVDPRKLALSNAELAGIVPEDSLPRLQEMSLAANQGAERFAQVKLELFRDEQGRLRVVGDVSVELLMQCQRCMEPLELSVTAQVNLAVCWDEDQAQQLAKDLDPWIVEEGQGDLHAVLEEELLLAMPSYALHDYACVEASQMSYGDATEVEKAVGDTKEDNPFNVLASIKQNLKKSD